MENKKYRIKFSKSNSLRFLGHLDTLALFQRIIIMVRLPIAYSKGKVIRPKILFAAPLSLEVSSKCEYVDLEMKKEVAYEKIFEMNNFFPDGLKILNVRELNENELSAPKEVVASTYEIHFQKNIDITPLNEDEILIEKKSKKLKTVEIINIKPLIYSAFTDEINKKILNVTIATGTKNLKPMEISKYLNSEKTKYVRCDILKEKSNKLISLWEE